MNRKQTVTILVGLMVGLAVGCGGEPQSDVDDGESEVTQGKGDIRGERSDSIVKTWDLDQLADEGYRDTPGIITGARLEEDELVIDVQYAGGCEEHGFRLHWDGKMLESSPPQARLTLYHDANGDFCEAAISEELRFDVSGFGAGEVILRLAGTDHRLTYEPGRGDEPNRSAKPLVVGSASELENEGYFRDGGSITSAALDGSTLTVEVQYGGGCEEHEFELHWNGEILESHPQRASLTLYHRSELDFCEASIRETLTFDVSALGEGETLIDLADSNVEEMLHE